LQANQKQQRRKIMGLDINYTELTDGESHLLRTDPQLFWFLANQPNYLEQHKKINKLEDNELAKSNQQKHRRDIERMFECD
jgi:hypothetical protein